MTAVLSLLIPRLRRTVLYSLQATDALKGFTETTIQVTSSWPEEEHGQETPTTTRQELMGNFPSVVYEAAKGGKKLREAKRMLG